MSEDCSCEAVDASHTVLPSFSPGLYWWVVGQECHSDTAQQWSRGDDQDHQPSVSSDFPSLGKLDLIGSFGHLVQ